MNFLKRNDMETSTQLSSNNKLMNGLLFKLIAISIFILFNSFQTKAQSLVIDLQYNPMKFKNSNRTLLSGPDKQAGAVYKYSNLATIDGHVIYAKMTILEMSSGMVIRNFDDDVLTGDINRFQPRLGNTKSSDGQVLYQLEFFDQSTDWPVYLYNYWLTGVDIDGDGSLREYNEIGGYSSYTIDAANQLTITTNSSTGRTKFEGINYSLSGVTFENKASYMAKFENANNKITFALGMTRNYSERYFSVQLGQAGGTFPNPNPVNNPLPVAVDDYGIIIDKSVGGTSVNNILDNDLYDGDPVVPSEVNIALITGASNSGVQLNTSTGEVTVDPGTPVGDYTMIYQICMVADGSKCDLATIYVSVVEKKADLAVDKQATPNPVLAGENLTYSIVVTNNGPNTAVDAVLTDVLHGDLTLVSATPSIGSFSGSTWTIGDIPSGSDQSITIVAKVDAAYSGSLENTANVTSSTTDPNLDNNTSTTTVTVNALVGPTANDDNTTTPMNTAVDINVLTNDVKGSGDIDPTTVRFVSAQPNPTTEGVFTVNATTGLVTFTPVNGYTGTVTIDYEVCDLNGLCDIAKITVVVAPVAGPTANDDNATTPMDTPVDINVLSNDTKGVADLDPTTVRFVSAQPNPTTEGVFTVNETTGLVTFTPVNGFIGTVSIDYEVCDLNGLCDQAKITVIIEGNLENELAGTLAFEDLWPGKGDYDFNDLVLDYNFKTTSNSGNYVEKIEASFTIQAFGAGLENGFGFQLAEAIDQADITVSGYSLTANYITLKSNGVEDGQSKATIIVYDNAFNEMEHPGVGIGVNTEPSAPYVAPKTINILITFPANTYTINDLDIASFNPFLIVNQSRGHEVHLPNYLPTDLMDLSLLATFDDDSKPGENRYWKTTNNLPWAINIYEKFDYPKEKREISTAFLHFIEWAESGGTLFADWYKDKPGYRNATNIYDNNTP
jgi:LruC domain-containing protein/uncharacterized repeat protein (TIGR01451 family)